jgi:hypothetical protein
MPVLVEAISVIIRIQAIRDNYPSGWESFVQNAPNSTLCYDNELARVGFMAPDDCETYVNHLKLVGGLQYLKNGKCIDIAVADQQQGCYQTCDWAEFKYVELEPGQPVYAARMKGDSSQQLYCPHDWEYEKSLSHKFTFVPVRLVKTSMQFLRHEASNDVYLDISTGKEVFVGRTMKKED